MAGTALAPIRLALHVAVDAFFLVSSFELVMLLEPERIRGIRMKNIIVMAIPAGVRGRLKIGGRASRYRIKGRARINIAVDRGPSVSCASPLIKVDQRLLRSATGELAVEVLVRPGRSVAAFAESIAVA